MGERRENNHTQNPENVKHQHTKAEQKPKKNEQFDTRKQGSWN
jgi:hypothetical protein